MNVTPREPVRHPLATPQRESCSHPTPAIPTREGGDSSGDRPGAQARTGCPAGDWLERLHGRALDRIQSGTDRRSLQACQLAPVIVGGWPTWEIRSAADLPIAPALHASYRAALAEVLREAAAALLAPWPGSWELGETWGAVLERLDLPSTRMLLWQQCRLRSLDELTATVEVAPTWRAMVESRRTLIEAALEAAIGRPLALLVVDSEVLR